MTTVCVTTHPILPSGYLTLAAGKPHHRLGHHWATFASKNSILIVLNFEHNLLNSCLSNSRLISLQHPYHRSLHHFIPTLSPKWPTCTNLTLFSLPDIPCPFSPSWEFLGLHQTCFWPYLYQETAPGDPWWDVTTPCRHPMPLIVQPPTSVPSYFTKDNLLRNKMCLIYQQSHVSIRLINTSSVWGLYTQPG